MTANKHAVWTQDHVEIWRYDPSNPGPRHRDISRPWDSPGGFEVRCALCEDVWLEYPPGDSLDEQLRIIYAGHEHTAAGKPNCVL